MEVSSKFAQSAKDYAQYVHAQKLLLAEEDRKLHHQQYNTDVACLFLPDYLYEETQQQTGSELSENMVEFAPAMLYTEQLMRLLPRETAVRFKIFPAFEETLMRWQEQHD